jgi:hypothetical protein
MNINKNLFIVLFLSVCIASEPVSDINAKVAQLDIETADLDKIISIFGEPEKYVWDKETFQRQNLPVMYALGYPDRFFIVMVKGHIYELRFHQPGYIFRDKIQVGSSLEEVLKVIGQPTETVVNQKNMFKDGVLYKDIDGRKGVCYYSRDDQNVRFFFSDYKVAGLYVISQMHKKAESLTSMGHSFDSVKEFNDVRWSDLSKLDLSKQKELLPTLTFNKNTVWPSADKMPGDYDPNKLMTDAMNPGLGVRELHKEGITGKGVNVAIIDQAMYLDHPEFVGKITAYHDLAAGKQWSMHGPAVTSLLVGINCGTAPDAHIYYCAVRDMVYEVDYAKALNWIVQQNKSLPDSEKIRAVSVSAAPGKIGTPSKAEQEKWDEAYVQAEASGILVLDCTNHHGFIGACWYDANDPENTVRCKPGFPGIEINANNNKIFADKILVPASPRTTAEEYEKGKFGYQYCGRGGVSWAIPYCSGVLALGWQIRPELTAAQMRELLFQSAYVKENQAKIINPKEFIRLVRNFKSF